MGDAVQTGTHQKQLAALFKKKKKYIQSNWVFILALPMHSQVKRRSMQRFLCSFHKVQDMKAHHVVFRRARTPIHPSVEPQDHSSHVLRWPPILHQEVNHTFRPDEQVAAQEENPKDNGEGEDTEHGNLHHPSDEDASLIRTEDQRATTIVGDHSPATIAAFHQGAKTLRGIIVSSLVQHCLVKESPVHLCR